MISSCPMTTLLRLKDRIPEKNLVITVLPSLRTLPLKWPHMVGLVMTALSTLKPVS